MRLYDDIPVWGDPVDDGALTQARKCRETADAVAMMADHHLGYSVPIGGVVVYKDAVSPSGVGYDIGCGNKAVLLDASLSDVRERIGVIMDDIAREVSFGMGRNNNERVDHPLFDDEAWKVRAVSGLKELARNQLGTVGGGNHYVDVFHDEQGRVWVGVHFGSRGLGHKTATHFLKEGGAKDGIHEPPLVLRSGTPLADDYVACMTLAGRYAYAGRDWVCEKVATIIGAKILREVHNHHNYAWQEIQQGERVWVVRKGATPAFPGQLGFIGATMGEPALIVEGRESAESRSAFYSTVHGAGRAMSRTAAKGKTNRKTGEILSPGLVSREAMDEWVGRAGVELRGADLDEAPQAYKRLSEVIAHHADTLTVLHTLTPIGVAMAGRDIYDPFKD